MVSLLRICRNHIMTLLSLKLFSIALSPCYYSVNIIIYQQVFKGSKCNLSIVLPNKSLYISLYYI